MLHTSGGELVGHQIVPSVVETNRSSSCFDELFAEQEPVFSFNELVHGLWVEFSSLYARPNIDHRSTVSDGSSVRDRTLAEFLFPARGGSFGRGMERLSGGEKGRGNEGNNENRGAANDRGRACNYIDARGIIERSDRLEWQGGISGATIDRVLLTGTRGQYRPE